jgi:hypothetical protein
MKTLNIFYSLIIVSFLLTACSKKAPEQKTEVNYDESKVPHFTLPDPLVTSGGEKVTTAEEWESRRRPEVLALFKSQMYGKFPDVHVEISFEPLEENRDALDGTAIRKQIRAHFSGNGREAHMNILIYLPKNVTDAVPLFVGMNFYGNQTICKDTAIVLSDSWARNSEAFGVKNNRSSEAIRGVRASRWPVKEIIKRGYGLATIYYGDVDPDFDDGFQNGIHPLFYKEGKTKPAVDEWGSIGAWAWGLSRAMDYFETDPEINQNKIAIIGHSRLGKTSLWAGATDPRFALVISNDSGCGGAALSRRRYGETVAIINAAFPHWFCGNFKKYNDNEDALPFDQHMLIALMAPRPVYIASAEQDRWADPKGEFLSGLYASPVYKLYGLEGMPATQMPPVDHPVAGTIGYHIRTGKHDLTLYDWQQYMDFADKHIR